MRRLCLLAATFLFACLTVDRAGAQNAPVTAETGPSSSAAAPLPTGLAGQPTLYVVGYAHLDTEWRWEYPQVIDEYLRKTMEYNFPLFEKYPHYIFNFSGANRYRLMKEYFPADFAKLKGYVAAGRWFPAGSSMEEGDVNAPSAEGIIRQVLYGNDWFRTEFGKASAEYMLPDCFGFPASLPSILAHAGVKGFSTQKLTWGSSAPGGGPESREKTPIGVPFNVGVWVGPDGGSVLAALNPGNYGGNIDSDLSQPFPPAAPNPDLETLEKSLAELERKLQTAQKSGAALDPAEVKRFFDLSDQQQVYSKLQSDRASARYQDDWAARVLQNGKSSGVFADYRYYGTGDIGGGPEEDSVKRLEAIVTKGTVSLPLPARLFEGQAQPVGGAMAVGEGPVRVVSANADQMFRDISPTQATGLPRYTGEMELTNHSAGSLTSQAYHKRWMQEEELLADAAEKSSIAAEWLGARTYPRERLNRAWTLAMGGHFHDIAAGTATPKSYEYAWNDDVIAMNQFAGVFQDATGAVAAALNTQTRGVPMVVFNALNVAREDVVEASLDFGGIPPKAVRVTGPDGRDVPAQISHGKVLFLARVPSVGYAVFDVQPVKAGSAAASSPRSKLAVSETSLDNQSYSVKLDPDGDVASISYYPSEDKLAGIKLLSAPARLALSYDNPEQWPAWNMDWEQEQAAPKMYVGGPARVRIVEQGPVRVAVEVSRQMAGSSFVQTIRLSAGDAGKRVEFDNVVDWTTKESNLKAAFPLTASNLHATYNLDIGTISRPTAQPNKFEVASHQWIDLTDASGEFGATLLTGSKNGSDKPNDNTLRLTLIRTPGTRGGFADQGTQDIGHHEFLFGLAGHAGDWRQAATDWQGQRLNNPLVAFTTTKHAGALGREFSLLQVSNPRIRLLALKKAEHDDELIVRLVELDGRAQPKVRISFAAPVLAAREMNAQEQPLGSATVANGAVVASFSAHQPRTFAVSLAAAKTRLPPVRSVTVPLPYDLASASNDGSPAAAGFDGKGNALPAEMLPEQIVFQGVPFHLAPAKTGAANALVAKGQTIPLPAGAYNRAYILAASSEGDQSADFAAGTAHVRLDINSWGGFIGQWDNRRWSSNRADQMKDNYGEMTGLTPGFIQRADLAWFASHHHNAAGANVPYQYSYLFAYPIDIPAGAASIALPNNDKVRILALSVAEQSPEAKPAQPLYDVLP